MDSAELIRRLRRDSGFRALPLLGTTGTVVGLHLTRFLPGGHLDVVQAWSEGWAAYVRLPDVLSDEAPFDFPAQKHSVSGELDRIVSPLLPLMPTPRHLLEAIADSKLAG
jgi:hypothetical protein